jgi:hypothetical protein
MRGWGSCGEGFCGLGLLLAGGADLESGRVGSASLLGFFLFFEAALEIRGELFVFGPGGGAV